MRSIVAAAVAAFADIAWSGFDKEKKSANDNHGVISISASSLSVCRCWDIIYYISSYFGTV